MFSKAIPWYQVSRFFVSDISFSFRCHDSLPDGKHKSILLFVIRVFCYFIMSLVTDAHTERQKKKRIIKKIAIKMLPLHGDGHVVPLLSALSLDQCQQKRVEKRLLDDVRPRPPIPQTETPCRLQHVLQRSLP